jgi:hypothetical protein
MVSACRKLEIEDEYMQGFGVKFRRKETTMKTYT